MTEKTRDEILDTSLGSDLVFVPIEYSEGEGGGRIPGDPSLHEIWSVRTKEIQATWSESTERARSTTSVRRWNVPLLNYNEVDTPFMSMTDLLSADTWSTSRVKGEDDKGINSGSGNRYAILTEAQVVRIRFGGEPVAKLAKELKIGEDYAYRIKLGYTWKYVTLRYARLNYADELSAGRRL